MTDDLGPNTQPRSDESVLHQGVDDTVRPCDHGREGQGRCPEADTSQAVGHHDSQEVVARDSGAGAVAHDAEVGGSPPGDSRRSDAALFGSGLGTNAEVWDHGDNIAPAFPVTGFDGRRSAKDILTENEDLCVGVGYESINRLRTLASRGFAEGTKEGDAIALAATDAAGKQSVRMLNLTLARTVNMKHTLAKSQSDLPSPAQFTPAQWEAFRKMKNVTPVTTLKSEEQS